MIDIKLKIPSHFLDEEVRCGYTISKKMKEVWAIELDLLVEFERVCKKYGLKYSATGGSMLGAIRHKGFIPWDDDIDLMMLRSDYNKLCEVASREFKDPYFFQTEYTDPGSLRGHAQLRNSHTTAILENELQWHYPFNQGIFIDIFPVDAVIDDENLFNTQLQEAQSLKEKYKNAANLTIRFHNGKNPFKVIVKTVMHCLASTILKNHYDYDKYYKKFEEVCQRYNHQQTKYLSLLSFQFDNPRHYKTRKGFENIEYVPFEFLTMPITSDYDEILKIQYGDYMTMQKVSTIHGGLIMDTNISYKEYFKKVKEK